MAKLKRMSNIVNWDILDTMFEHEVKGLNIKLNGFERCFCRCGETFTSWNNMCSHCDNYSFETLKNENLNCFNVEKINFDEEDSLLEMYTYGLETDSNGEHFFINKRNLMFKEDSSGNVKFEIKEENVIKIYENAIMINKMLLNEASKVPEFARFRALNLVEILESKQKYDILEFFEKNCQHLIEAHEEYFKFIRDDVTKDIYTRVETLNYNVLYKTIISCCFQYSYKNLLTDIELYKYPNILRGLIDDFISFMFENRYVFNYCQNIIIKEPSNLEELYGFKFDYNIAEFFAKENNSLGFTLFEPNWYMLKDKNYRTDDFTIRNYNAILEQIETHPKYSSWTETKKLAKLVNHYVCNGMIMFYEAHNLLMNVLISANDSDSEYLSIYLKENVAINNKDIFNNFTKQIDIMRGNKIPLIQDNFKIKNFNFLLNQISLASTYRLPQEKVDMFLEMFEVNPLEALTLISNRRKMTKKELDKFLETMLKY